jgi:hypothetical protein
MGRSLTPVHATCVARACAGARASARPFHAIGKDTQPPCVALVVWWMEHGSQLRIFQMHQVRE